MNCHLIVLSSEFTSCHTFWSGAARWDFTFRKNTFGRKLSWRKDSSGCNSIQISSTTISSENLVKKIKREHSQKVCKVARQCERRWIGKNFSKVFKKWFSESSQFDYDSSGGFISDTNSLRLVGMGVLAGVGEESLGTLTTQYRSSLITRRTSVSSPGVRNFV